MLYDYNSATRQTSTVLGSPSGPADLQSPTPRKTALFRSIVTISAYFYNLT
jgi:hypothetical protein